MLKYSSIGSPIGPVYAAASERGVCAVGLGCSERAFLAECPGAVRDDAALAGPLAMLRRYLAGEAVSFEGVKLDLSRGTALQQAVWRELAKVPRGRTVSYGWLARRVGRPRAARAIGNIVGRNPVPIIVPCHRVIHADGTLGGFSSGIEIKKLLLNIEKAETGPCSNTRRRAKATGAASSRLSRACPSA